jgi:hypothetical protein
MALPVSSRQCACPDCTCDVAPDNHADRDGKTFCSLACADMHPAGAPCPGQSCHCEEATRVQDRSVSEPQLDKAVEESFPASDPISP